MADSETIVLKEGPAISSGKTFGASTGDPISFYNATPIVQRANASQAAVGTTASTSTSPFGFGSSTQADAIVTLLNEVRAALVAVGLIKGGA